MLLRVTVYEVFQFVVWRGKPSTLCYSVAEGCIFGTEFIFGAVAGHLHDCQHTGAAERFCHSSVLWQGYALC